MLIAAGCRSCRCWRPGWDRERRRRPAVVGPGIGDRRHGRPVRDSPRWGKVWELAEEVAGPGVSLSSFVVVVMMNFPSGAV